MPALYIAFRNGDSLFLGCSEAEGLAAYNAVMEDTAGFVDLNNGEKNFRIGLRAADIVSISYNPNDSETVLLSSALQKIQLGNAELARFAKESEQASPTSPQGSSKEAKTN